MSQWVRNDSVTAQIRSDPDCPPDTCVYDKGSLRAVVMYADVYLMPGLRWHVVLVTADGKPSYEQARAAWDDLLPGIEVVCYLPTRDTAGENAIHFCEVVPEHRRGLQ